MYYFSTMLLQFIKSLFSARRDLLKEIERINERLRFLESKILEIEENIYEDESEPVKEVEQPEKEFQEID